MKKIVVIGAGYAGVLTAKKLAKKFKKNDEIEISIIDKNSYHTMLTELHEVAAGRVDEESIKMELSDIFAHRKVNVILDEVQNVDFEKKIVHGTDTTYDYDIVVMASGCRPTFFSTKGHEHAYELWSYNDAILLKEQIEYCFRAAACTKDPVERQKLLTFAIVGQGFTGVEMAGELGEHKAELCRKFNIDPQEVRIYNLDVCARLLPNYPAKLQEKVERKFKKFGIEILNGNAVEEIGEDFLIVGDKKIDSYTTIWAAGIEGSKLVNNTDGIEQGGRGRFKTNSYLQSVSREDVYVVGDNIFFIPEGFETPVPQMVENAELSSGIASKNIAAQIEGKDLIEYKPKFNGSMVSIGGRYGVASIGSNPAKMKSFSGFPAMFIKHFINFIYFIQVLGLHKCWSYAKHEFFTVKNRRSFLGGHFSNQENAPTIFLVPLRIFLGIMWLMSGIAKLPGVLNDWTKVTSFPSKAIRMAELGATGGADATAAATDAASSGGAEAVAAATDAAASGGADAVAAATDAATGAADVVLTGFDAFAKSAGDMFELVSAGGTPVPRPGFVQSIMDWMYQTFFWSGDNGFTTLAAIFQSGVVFAELGIGLMFILGFLTPLASIISFFLMIMIWMSGWSYMSIFFYGLAGLACFMAGKSFGLDYYFLPWLDKKLRTWKFTKKWYLYFK